MALGLTIAMPIAQPNVAAMNGRYFYPRERILSTEVLKN